MTRLLIVFPPCGPDDAPTPAAEVATLTRPEREQRVRWLMMQSDSIIADALDALLAGRELVATCVLFSGGNDSTTLAHMYRDRATHAIHANTTIGIEQTRQYVRDTCAKWNLPLIEKLPPVSYRELVIERGFPGPASHWKMFSRLKERALDAARREDLGISRSRKKAALFLAGRRRSESDRRAEIPLYERDGSVIWCSPLAHWTKLDLNTYRLMFGDVPSNEVSDLLHMSGECLCGAFAHPGELAEIEEFFPEVAAEIRALEAEVRAAGHPEELCTWGHGLTGKQLGEFRKGRLCSSCEAPSGGGDLVRG